MILTWIHHYYDGWEMVFFFYSIILSSEVSWHSVSSWAILRLFVCLSIYLSVSFNLSIFLLAEIHGFLFWARGYNLLLTLLFWRSTCLGFGHYSSFTLTSISFSMPSSFFERFIPVWKHISGSFTLPRSENQPFLQVAPDSCSGGWCSEIKTWTLGVLIAPGRLSF